MLNSSMIWSKAGEMRQIEYYLKKSKLHSIIHSQLRKTTCILVLNKDYEMIGCRAPMLNHKVPWRIRII